MRVVFRRTGGVAGRTLGCSLDSASMPAKDAAALFRLVESAALQSTAGPAPPGAARDLVSYEIEVDDRGTVTRACFDDANVHPEAAPLIEFLVAQARG